MRKNDGKQLSEFEKNNNKKQANYTFKEPLYPLQNPLNDY